MAKYCKSGSLNPINHLMRINNLQQSDIAKVLNVTKNTLRGYISNPNTMSLMQISCLAGYFGLKVEVLVYLLIRNKTQIRPKDKNDKWYIEDVRLEGEKLLGEFPRE